MNNQQWYGRTVTVRILTACFLFVLICLCGVFIGNAGGVHWGTPECGLLAFYTIAFAILLSGIVFIEL